MKVDEISHLTGLDQKDSRLAALREYDEPFVIFNEKPSDRDSLFKAAEQRGLTISTGGRFYHLQGGNDKGQSMEMIISWYEAAYGGVASIALGDSPNDFPMLERADYPVLIRSRREFPVLREKIQHLRVTDEMGPSGWNSAILDILTTGLKSI
jgi:mannosyl-3-phosphoglycerate phosphatase